MPKLKINLGPKKPVEHAFFAVSKIIENYKQFLKNIFLQDLDRNARERDERRNKNKHKKKKKKKKHYRSESEDSDSESDIEYLD